MMDWTAVFLALICVLLDGARAVEDVLKFKSFVGATFGYVLNDGLFLTVSPATEPRCMFLCVKHDNCVSYNFGTTQDGIKQCQISSKDVYTSQVQLEKKDNFLHRSIDNACHRQPCGPYKTCSPNFSTGSYSCHCETEHLHHRDKKCYGEVPVGANKANPGLSCKDIVQRKGSDGNGEYWVKPKSLSEPIIVYCDMTTDSGGWTLLTKLTYPEAATMNYRSRIVESIQNYAVGNQAPTLSAMGTLQQAFDFSQLRFTCFKSTPGRTVDIATTQDDKGKAVVQFFTGSTDTRPPSCGSFFKLPIDNSRLSVQCADWHEGTWSWVHVTREHRLIDHSFFVWGTYHYIVMSGRLECDDVDPKAAPGDNWRVYFR